MALYLIAFNDEWVPDLTLEEIRERGTSGRAVIEEMTVAGVFVFSDGGLDASTVLCSVDPSSGSPVFTDGPFIETKEHLGGFAVVDVPDDAEARYWAGRIAVAVGWPQEVHRFPHRIGLTLTRSPRPCLDWDDLMGKAERTEMARAVDLTAVVAACTME